MDFVIAASAVKESMIFSYGFVADTTFTAVYTLMWFFWIIFMICILFFGYFVTFIVCPFVTSIAQQGWIIILYFMIAYVTEIISWWRDGQGWGRGRECCMCFLGLSWQDKQKEGC